MRGTFGQRFQRQTDRVCDCFVTNLARRAGTGFIIQTIKPIGGKAFAPDRDRRLGAAKPRCYLLILQTIGSQKNNTRAARLPSPDLAPSLQPLKFRALPLIKFNCYRDFAH